MDLLRRRPLRVTATLPWHLVQHLQERADYEGRSLSNLIAHMLEAAKQYERLHGRWHAALLTALKSSNSILTISSSASKYC